MDGIMENTLSGDSLLLERLFTEKLKDRKQKKDQDR